MEPEKHKAGGARTGAGRKAKMEGGKDYAFRLGQKDIAAIEAAQKDLELDSRSAALRAIIQGCTVHPKCTLKPHEHGRQD